MAGKEEKCALSPRHLEGEDVISCSGEGEGKISGDIIAASTSGGVCVEEENKGVERINNISEENLLKVQGAEAASADSANKTDTSAQQQNSCIIMSVNPINSNDEQSMPCQRNDGDANQCRQEASIADSLPRATLIAPVVSRDHTPAASSANLPNYSAKTSTATAAPSSSTSRGQTTESLFTSNSTTASSFPLLPNVYPHHRDPSGWNAWMHQLMHRYKVLQSQREKSCVWREHTTKKECSWKDQPTSQEEASNTYSQPNSSSQAALSLGSSDDEQSKEKVGEKKHALLAFSDHLTNFASSNNPSKTSLSKFLISTCTEEIWGDMMENGLVDIDPHIEDETSLLEQALNTKQESRD